MVITNNMERKEKVDLLKAIQKGDLTRLKELQKEQRLEEIQDEYFVSCFYYLLENQKFDQDVYNCVYHKTHDELISIFKEGRNCFKNDKNYSRVSFEALLIFKNILETITELKSQNQLHLLESFKKY